VESATNHPLAVAIVEAATSNVTESDRDSILLPVTEAKTLPGLGVVGEVGGKLIYVGSAEWLSTNQIDPPDVPSELKAKTLVHVAVEGMVAGTIALEDRLRPEAQSTVAQLQKRGLEVALLTGDRASTAEAIAKTLGIARVYAEVKPEQKAEIIQALQQDRVVAMVGDGINDAPALAAANVGIAVEHGTDVAIEAAAIVLVRWRGETANLAAVPAAIDLSIATYRKIQQNLFWALGYNLITIPIAAGVLLPSYGILLSPAVAAALMACSSIIVVSNSLLLYRQKHRIQT
jgi:Cu2+-exporting ATPase